MRPPSSYRTTVPFLLTTLQPIFPPLPYVTEFCAKCFKRQKKSCSSAIRTRNLVMRTRTPHSTTAPSPLVFSWATTNPACPQSRNLWKYSPTTLIQWQYWSESKLSCTVFRRIWLLESFLLSVLKWKMDTDIFGHQKRQNWPFMRFLLFKLYCWIIL